MSNNKWTELLGGDTAPEEKHPGTGSQSYARSLPISAFETQDKLLGFTVHCPSTQTGHQFFYHHLHTITFNEPDYSFLFLTTSTSVIRIVGYNLQPLANAFAIHTCKSVTEYHPELFSPLPPDDGEPFIEKIEVSLIKGAEIPQREKQAAEFPS
jgi:hypothetical protein